MITVDFDGFNMVFGYLDVIYDQILKSSHSTCSIEHLQTLLLLCKIQHNIAETYQQSHQNHQTQFCSMYHTYLNKKTTIPWPVFTLSFIPPKIMLWTTVFDKKTENNWLYVENRLNNKNKFRWKCDRALVWFVVDHW